MMSVAFSYSTPSLLLCAAVTALIVSRWYVGRNKASSLRYPPGPPGHILLGNALDIPTTQAHRTYAAWQREYHSAVLHVEALGQHIVVVNSFKDAMELLDFRAIATSGRPTMPMTELMGFTWNTALLQYGDRWRSHRKFYEKAYRPEHLPTYAQTKNEKVQQMLFHLIDKPQDFLAHIKTFASAVPLITTYGHMMAETNDPIVELIAEAIAEASKNLLPGANLVNIFPILRHLPSWLPGVKFKKTAAAVKILTDRMLDLPFQDAKQRMAVGTQPDSILTPYLQSPSEGESEAFLKEVTATTYAGGVEPIASAISTLFLCLARDPSIQIKAQAEIDNMVGHARLPDFNDLPNLPYCEAIYREVLRWGPPNPLGFPHATTEDIVHEGYFIPKGTYILTNIWAMTRDETRYPDPERFIPERFLDEKGNLNQDRRVLTFGFGRRGCPGQAFAQHTLLLAFASILASFDVRKARDEQGEEIEVVPRYTEGVVCVPETFSCTIMPRSQNVVALVRRAVDDIQN